MIPYGKQDITEDDINQVIKVLKSDFITQGPVLPAFEKELALLANSKYAVAMNSATSALHLACDAIGLKKNDWLWTSPISFVASANCGRYCGANIDFIDIDPFTFNICPEKLEKKLLLAHKKSLLPKVIVAVHLAGKSCDMEQIYNITKLYNIKIIEDASHAIGAFYQKEPVGSCKYSDITVFSFHPVKIITTGEGGAALTNNKKYFETMESKRQHCIEKKFNEVDFRNNGDWYYEQTNLGFNYRMTDIQAALGLSQLKRIKEFIKKRHIIANKYINAFNNSKIHLPIISLDDSLHLFIIRFTKSKFDTCHKKIFRYLRDSGIGVNLHYIPIHLQPYYRTFGFKYGDFVEAEKYYSEAISLPIFPKLKEDDQKHIIDKVLSIK
jgi:UDP-4-amino-4,6-dideoxy-N-acetyl-beta-L-altrosamine transaminase